MRKIVVFMLLLLMATGVAFAGEDIVPDTAAEDGIGPNDTQMEPEATEPEATEPETTEPIDLGAVKLRLAPTYVATGSAIKPKPALIYEGAVLTGLTPGVDYELVYSNNVKPGTATVIAVALESENAKCTGTSQSVEFQITAIPLSKVKVTLAKKTRYKTGSQITPKPLVQYGSVTLRNNKDYTLKYSNNIKVGTAKVTVVFAAGGRFAAGSKSLTFPISPAKPKAAPIKKIKSDKPYVNVTWTKVACTGYELQVSLNSDFSKATKYKLKATTKKVPKLKDKKKYYFRVRAYNTENKKTTYGAWKKDSSKVKTTGEVGDRYSKNGAYIKDKTIKLDGNSYYYNEDGLKSGCSEKMWDKVKNTKSGTKYLIAVDCGKNRTCIYKGKKGDWKLKDYWKCTTGKKSTPTIKGKFKVCGKVSHFGEQKGYSVWYATRIKYEYYFHSILYRPWSKSSVLSGTLGKNLSHGCIRLKLKNAKWIYNNCKSGTKIVIY